MRVPSISAEEILNTIGLQRRRDLSSYVMPGLGLVGVGVLIGASLGMLFTTAGGRRMRRTMRHAARRAVGHPTPTASQVMQGVRGSAYGHAEYGVGMTDDEA